MRNEQTVTSGMEPIAVNGSEPEGRNGRGGREEERTYWWLVKRQYRKNRLAVVCYWFVLLMVGVALFADFLANNRPIICSYKGAVYAPIVHDYLVGIRSGTGIDLVPSYPAELLNADWKSLSYDWSVFPSPSITMAPAPICSIPSTPRSTPRRGTTSAPIFSDAISSPVCSTDRGSPSRLASSP